MLELRGVGKVFGGLEALRDVSLELEAGRIYGLIGPNGAGKTTLFNGQAITHWPPHRIARLGVARTYQLVRPFFELTALENVEVGIAYGRRPGSEPPRDVHADGITFLERVGLADKHDHVAEALNLGERKRLEIAKALAAQPELILFDEVLAGLNATETAAAVELFRQINRMGITILMIEHNMAAIMAACQHLFVLHHGELIAAGSPEHVSRNAAVIEAYLGRKDHRLERRRQSPTRA